MASIITATVSSGLTQQADNSGVLQLASGTGNLVTVPSVTGTAMVSGNMPAFSAYGASNQGFTSAVATKITLDTEVFDTNNNFASSRFTPTVAGYYQINGKARITGTGLSEATCAIYKNGSQLIISNLASSIISSTLNFCVVSTITYLNGSTDYIELYGYATTTAGNPTFQAIAIGNNCEMSGCLVRSA